MLPLIQLPGSTSGRKVDHRRSLTTRTRGSSAIAVGMHACKRVCVPEGRPSSEATHGKSCCHQVQKEVLMQRQLTLCSDCYSPRGSGGVVILRMQHSRAGCH